MTTTVNITSIIVGGELPPLPCFYDPFHVYGISCLLNLLMLFLPQFIWPILSPPHNVYISWNTSLLGFHIYWIYQSGYRLGNNGYMVIVLVFFALVITLTKLSSTYTYLLPILMMLLIWTYAATDLIGFMGLALCALFIVVLGAICYNTLFLCASIEFNKSIIRWINSIMIGMVSAFSLRFIIEQQQPQLWFHVGQTTVCCITNPHSIDEFSTNCPLSFTLIIILGMVGFTLVHRIYNYCIELYRVQAAEANKNRIIYVQVPMYSSTANSPTRTPNSPTVQEQQQPRVWWKPKVTYSSLKHDSIDVPEQQQMDDLELVDQ